jgi:hypothetical protein
MLPIKRVLYETIALTRLTVKLGRWFQFLKDCNGVFLGRFSHSGA